MTFYGQRVSTSRTMATAGAEGGEEEGEERRGGGGRENDQNGLKGCYHTIDSSARTWVKSNPHGRSRINLKLRRGINKSLCHSWFYSPIDGGFNSAITATTVAPRVPTTLHPRPTLVEETPDGPRS